MATDVTAKIEGDELVIRMPINKAAPLSKSGSTRIIATSGGNAATGAKFKYKGVEYGVTFSGNAWIKPSE
jgi:hypothetical protein